MRLVALLAALGLAACAGRPGPLPDDPPEEPPGREDAERMSLDETAHGELHCDAGSCARWHRLTTPAPGDLRIEITALAGPDVPDFDVRLEDADGDVLWGFAPTGESPRQITRMVPAGDYYLLIESIGENLGRLAYEARAWLEGGTPILQPVPAGGQPAPRRTPRSGEAWMSAEIVQVEGSGGLPQVIVLDGGVREGWETGQRGELVEAGRVIAGFELVEVDETHSRGRLDAAPIEEITFETRARIRIPLE